MKGILEIITLNKVNLKFSYTWEQEKYIYFFLYLTRKGVLYYDKHIFLPLFVLSHPLVNLLIILNVCNKWIFNA